MRYADILLASAFLLGVAACDGGDEQAGKFTTEPNLIAAAPTDDAIALVIAISENLRSLPQIDVEIETTLRYGGDERSGREVLHLGPGDTIDWSGPGFHMRSVDGRLHAVIDAVSDRMVDVPLEGELIHAVEDALVVSPPPALLVMRSGAPFATWIQALTSQLFPGAQLVSVDLMDDGGYLIELASAADALGAEGSAQITFDASGLPRRILLAGVMASGMEPVDMYYEVRMNPIAPEEDRPVMTPDGRQVVQSVPELTSSGTNQIPKIDVGDAAPDFTLPSTDGTEISLASLRGRCVVLDFWATWCVPCRKGLPEIERIHQATGAGSHDVLVFGVNVLDGASMDKVKKFWSTQSLSFPSLVDTTESMTQAWGMQGIPVTIIIGPEGIVRARIDGYEPGEWEHLVAEIHKFCPPEQQQASVAN